MPPPHRRDHDPGSSDPGEFEPGQFVRHAARPDWGLGQVQSAVGSRVTVNFENAGKILVNAAAAPLRIVADPDATPHPDGSA